MKNAGMRWTATLLVLSGGLSIAAVFLRSGGEPLPVPLRTAEAAARNDLLPSPAPPPESGSPELPSSTPPLPAQAARRSARDDGYREAREASWEGTLSGQVVSSEGPIANFNVRVEWLLAVRADPEEAARLKRGGARRDQNGAWWARTLAQTDEFGCFQVEGLPAVPLRLTAGSATEQVRLGDFVQIRTARP